MTDPAVARQMAEGRGVPPVSNIPIPDPSFLTTEQLLRAVQAERDYVDGQLQVIRQRLEGMDLATQLVNQSVTRVPSEVDTKIDHLKEINRVELASIALQFKERDTRSERESRDNKVAVDAAFAAQKEAASEQNKSNTLAIAKSEISTNETIKKLSELFESRTVALADKIDDVKQQLAEVRLQTNGVVQNRAGGAAAYATVIGLIFLAVTIASVGLGIISKIH